MGAVAKLVGGARRRQTRYRPASGKLLQIGAALRRNANQSPICSMARSSLTVLVSKLSFVRPNASRSCTPIRPTHNRMRMLRQVQVLSIFSHRRRKDSAQRTQRQWPHSRNSVHCASPICPESQAMFSDGLPAVRATPISNEQTSARRARNHVPPTSRNGERGVRIVCGPANIPKHRDSSPTRNSRCRLIFRLRPSTPLNVALAAVDWL